MLHHHIARHAQGRSALSVDDLRVNLAREKDIRDNGFHSALVIIPNRMTPAQVSRANDAYWGA